MGEKLPESAVGRNITKETLLMIQTSWKERLTSPVGEVMAALLVVQPLLDVLSYFMGQVDATWLTTTLRTVLLIAVCLYGFAITENRRAYYVMYGVVVGFWLLHIGNSLRLGYQDPVGDAAEYLKLVQFPLWTLSFVTFFRQRKDLDYRVVGMLAANFGIILLVIALSYVVGKPVYTYDYPDRNVFIGILGWFGVANSQSSILTLLVSPLLLWGLRSRRLWQFCLCCLFGFGLLYFTGTRLTYYGAILIACAFLVLLLFRRQQLLFCIPLCLALIVLVVFRGMSPMAERQALTADSYAIYQEKADEILGEDRDYVYQEGEEIPPEILEKITRVYTEVYDKPGLYGATLLEDLIDEFGLEAVMEQYDYATDPQTLYNTRVKKLTAMEMVWQDQDFVTKLVGVEYAQCHVGSHIYDPENDLPALLYYYGYLGVALYGVFALYFFVACLGGLIQDWKRVLCVEFGVPAMMFAMMLAGAQFSGQVLRKPSVTVYGSVAAALLYVYLHSTKGTGRAIHAGDRFVEREERRSGMWISRQGGKL